MATLVSVTDLMGLLTPVKRDGEELSRSWARQIANNRDFPAPVVRHRHLMLWLRRDVDAWIAAELKRRGQA
jgi:hypothetical protein